MSDHKLYLTYEESRSGGEPVSPDDKWTDYTDEHITFRPIAIWKDRENAGVFTHGLNDDEIFGDFYYGDVGELVIVRYSTGDTFGYSSGHWYLIGLFKDVSEASAIAKSINDDSFNGYKPWVGYFERLEDVELHTMRIK